MKKLAFVFLLACSLFSCRKTIPVERSAYFWKTEYRLQMPDYKEWEYENPVTDTFQVKNLYLRMFDVSWDTATRQAFPVASIEFPVHEYHPLPEVFIPVIFIENDVFLNATHQEPAELAQKMAQKMVQKMKEIVFLFYVKEDYQRELAVSLRLAETNEQLQIFINATFQKHIHEVQFDCDWSGSTREEYFALLEELKKQLGGCKISATIRLDQFKNFEKTGVPPVDRGMLMCYNVGSIKKLNEENSIFNPATIKLYLNTDVPYPLPLDLALPMFSWGVCFDARGEFTGIVYQTEKLAFNFRRIRPNSNVYTCVTETQMGGKFFRVGDKVRLEAPSLEDLQLVAPLLRNAILNARKPGDEAPVRMAIYDWDFYKWRKFGHDKIDELYRILD